MKSFILVVLVSALSMLAIIALSVHAMWKSDKNFEELMNQQQQDKED